MTATRHVSRCNECSYLLVPDSTVNVPEGHRRHHGGGLCNRCYDRAYRASRDPVRGSGQAGRPRTDDYVDPIAVDRAVAGERPTRMTTLEVREAVRRLTRLGYTNRETAERVGITDRSVQRHLTALRVKEAA